MSDVRVVLGWNVNSCNVDTEIIRICHYDSSKWVSLGKSNLTGNSSFGSVQTAAKIFSFGTFTLSTICNLDLNLSTINSSYLMSNGYIEAMASSLFPPFDYSWNTSPPQSTSNALNLDSGTYTVIVTDSVGCVVSDSASLINRGLQQGIDSLFYMMGDPNINYFDVVAYAEILFAANPEFIDSSGTAEDQEVEDNIYSAYSHWKEFWRYRYGMKNGIPGDRTNYVLALANTSSQGPNGGNSTQSIQAICSTAGSKIANWEALGPMQLSLQKIGKVHVVRPDPNDPSWNTVYLGLPGGGVFRTTNFRDPNPNWTCLTESSRAPGLWVNDIAIDPVSPFDIYVATGNQGREGDGIGVVKVSQAGVVSSTDLTTNPTRFVKKLWKILINPVDHLTVYAISTCDFYVTHDGGATWPSEYHDNGCLIQDIEFVPNTNYEKVIISGGEIRIWDENGGGSLSNPKYIHNSSVQNVGCACIQITTTNSSASTYPNSLFAIYRDGVDNIIDVSTDEGNTWTEYWDIDDNKINIMRNGESCETVMDPSDPNYFFGEAPGSGPVYRRVRIMDHANLSYAMISTYYAISPTDEHGCLSPQ